MFTTHSVESEHLAPARVHNFRAMRGIPEKTPIPAAHATSYRHLPRVPR
jgi:hypothetical protein